jgi:L-histidine N-alpha-methyltransferase
VKSPRLIQIAHEDPQAIRAELLAGLMAPKATIAPKYLYDALGSRLFSAITELPEYYPTRTEAAIFVREMNGMARASARYPPWSTSAPAIAKKPRACSRPSAFGATSRSTSR